MQAHCLTLVVNICVLCVTWYIQDAIEAEEALGNRISDEAKGQASPAHPSAINPYGTHNIDVAAVLGRGRRRSLRDPRRR